MIVKTVQFRKNLKELLKNAYDNNEELVLDYYGQLFEIVPKKSGVTKPTKKQKLITHFSKIKPVKLNSSIFDEANPSKEKENFRNLRYGIGNDK
jgi:hypothetical protein